MLPLRLCPPWRSALLATAAVLLMRGAPAADMDDLPPAAIDRFERAAAEVQDDPRATLEAQIQRLQTKSTNDEERFWALLLQAKALALLERPAELTKVLKQARDQLSAIRNASPVQGLAIRSLQLQLDALSGDVEALREPAKQLAADIDAKGSVSLACDVAVMRAEIESETSTVDEAWRHANTALECASALNAAELKASAYLQMGRLARGTSAGDIARQSAAKYFGQAIDALGERPARYLRSIIEWEAGKTLGREQVAQSETHFARALALSQEIGDDVGVAVASVDLASIALQLRKYSKAIELATHARNIYERNVLPQRIPSTYAITIPAHAAINWAAALREIEQAKALEDSGIAPLEKAHLARKIAEVYSSRQLFEQAYGELARSQALEATARQDEATRMVMRLQALHQAAQRDAENARLTLRNETARLELVAADARHGRLVAALGSTLFGLMVGTVVLARVLRQRRQLAAVALRDELTGAPNRRAIQAIAQAQSSHCKRMQMPLLVAMIDLDFFKKVNDVHGHPVGDLVLQAFAKAAASALRSQDRVGRYGGEEWLLVAPGAKEEDVQAIFDRICARYREQEIPSLPSPHGLTFSMGAALSPYGTANLSSMIAEADRCLYEAKSGGRNRAVLCGAMA